MKNVLPGPALLFCPGDRPDRFQRAVDTADGVILDLEDGVAPNRREHARQAVRTAIRDMDPDTTVVRVNPAGTPDHELDLHVLQDAPNVWVMVPKVEHPDDLRELTPHRTIALLESARGLLAASTVAAAPSCRALFWGAEDLTVDIGGRRTRDQSGRPLPHVTHLRTQTLLAAAGVGRPALDGVFTDIDDMAGLAQEAREASWMGYAAKAAIHPQQVPTIREAFRPEPDELERAVRLLDAADDAGSGAFAFEGRMIDRPLVEQARQIVRAASGTEVEPSGREHA